ncbi:MAG TPA: 4-alpha-glucanotransferase [Rhodocyclaceae bacterium]|nr:4-alpha-glucanotransferase [Rhodocyclaceae bacterium]
MHSNSGSDSRIDTIASLEALAHKAGIAVRWQDAHGIRRTVSPTVLRAVLNAMGFDCETEVQIDESVAQIDAMASAVSELCLIVGDANNAISIPLNNRHSGLDYRLELEGGQVLTGSALRESPTHIQLPGIQQMGYHRLLIADRIFRIAVAPPRCFSLSDAAGKEKPRLWGLAAQLYSLRGAAPSGVGDFGALAELAQRVGAMGASAICISPAHAMFGAQPDRFSPYSPSSRLFLNPVYADPRMTFDPPQVNALAAETGLAQELAALDRASLIDWPSASKARIALLRQIFQRRDTFFTPALREEFDRFRRHGGDALEDHARFEAMCAKVGRPSPEEDYAGLVSWHAWPLALRDPRSAEVTAFVEQHADEVSFQIFLQWLAARGLNAAQQSARAAGMPIGLVADLAVGTAHEGSHAWSRQREMLIGLSCGAPPDIYNPLGQSWGLAAFSPHALRVTGFEPFLEMLRATMIHDGGIRIDHVLGLQRLWLVPDGASPADGAYLSYPIDDLLRLIALESWRHRCIVIGENLGTVPAGFNSRLQRAGMLGTSVLWFEHHDNRFMAPDRWARDNVATTTTHDLPTVAGWWRGRDIDWRAQLHRLSEHSNENTERSHRESEKKELWTALRTAGLGHGDMPAADAPPIDAAIEFVAQSSASLVVLPLEDACSLVEQPNLPGTVSGHPNWQRRLPASLDAMFEDEQFVQRLGRLARARANTRETP